jgi:hypothetical protein
MPLNRALYLQKKNDAAPDPVRDLVPDLNRQNDAAPDQTAFFLLAMQSWKMRNKLGVDVCELSTITVSWYYEDWYNEMSMNCKVRIVLV